MAVIQKTLFPKNLDKYAVLVNDTQTDSKYFKITELPDTFTGGKNAFLIAGSEYLVPDTKIQIELRDAAGNIIYHEPGEGMINTNISGSTNTSIFTEYYEGVSKIVAVYIYPNTAYGSCTLTILGELSQYEDGNLILTPVPLDWENKYNVKWQKQINVNPSLANTTKIRFYQRPIASITEIVSPIYRIESGSKVDSGTNQSFANIKLSKLETFAGDVKRIKVFRTSEGDISDYDLIQDILVESKELLTSYGLSGSVVGQTGILTQETLKNNWNTGSLNAFLTSSRVESGVRLTGSGYFTYTSSLDIKSANTYELNLDAFYSASISTNLGIYLVSGSASSSIATLNGTAPTKNLLDTVIPFKVDKDFVSASLYFSQSQGEWHLGNISLKLSQDTAFSPDEISFVTTMPTVIGNETYNFKFEFYDINNNYVPVAVTQSATFDGGTIIGAVDTDFIISSSFASASILINAVSSSISGTMTVYSSSASSSVGSLSGSVSASLNSLSSSVSSSNVLILSSSLSKVQQLADGGYSGSFISGSIVGEKFIFSPVVGGAIGYFSEKFQVGKTNPIVLDASTATRKIYVGTGTYNNTNTSVYMDSGGQFSLKNKLTWDGNNLSVNGSITITNPSTANNGGAVGSFTNGDAITGGSIAGVTITSTKIYIGTGTFGNANTSFYVDNAGQFSLKDKLTWNGNALSITGEVVITGGATKTAIDTAQSTADSKITAGQVNANVTSISGGSITTGTVAANRIDVAGVISAGSIIVAGNNISSLTNNSGYQANGDAKSAGSVGGWSIDANSIRGNSPTGGGDGVFTTNAGIILSSAGWISSKNFYINSSGNAAFKGDITATGGSFTGNVTAGGVTIGASGINVTGTFGINISAAFGLYVTGAGTIRGTTEPDPVTYPGLYRQFESNRTPSLAGSPGQNAIWYVNNGLPGETGLYSEVYNSANWGLWSNGKVGGTAFPNTSDRRTKSEIKNLDSKFGIEFIKKLNPVEFKFNDDLEHKKFGFIAQEVTSSISDYGMNISNSSLVDGDPTNSEVILHLNYMELVAPLVKSVQQLSAKIEQLEAQISGSI